MKKIAIVTDTASDLSQSDLEKYNIKMLHYQIIYKNRTYKDQLEITSKEVLDHLEEEVPTTSLPPIEEMQEVFNQLEAEGYTDAIVIPLSSGLSGCYNAICMVAQDYNTLKIHTYDSRTISAAQAVLVIRAAEMAKEGHSVEEIMKAIDEMRKSQHTLFIVDTLKYLQLGGRIGRVTATVGTLLNLKPIITIGEDGRYETVAKVRGKAKAISSFIHMAKEVASDGSSYNAYLTHAAGEEIRDKIIEGLKGIDAIKHIEGENWISPVACVHCGPGYVGMLIQP